MDAVEIPPDVIDYVQKRFPASMVEYALAQLPLCAQGARMQRCIVFASQGNRWYFDFLCQLAKEDFREVILAGECTRFHDRLYDFNKPILEAELGNPFAPET